MRLLNGSEKNTPAKQKTTVKSNIFSSSLESTCPMRITSFKNRKYIPMYIIPLNNEEKNCIVI